MAKFDLTLHAVDAPDGLRLSLEYASDLFAAETIDQMLTQLRTLLDAVAVDGTQSTATVSLLTAQERQALVHASGPPPSPYPHRCLHELIRDAAARHGERVAVQSGDAELTYASLERRANQLAHHLRELGVRPGVLVGVCLERTVDVLVAVLAVIKSGGAYVPIDPAFPRARQELMLSDSGAGLLVTHERLSSGAGPVLLIDRDGRSSSATPPRHPRWSHDPEQLAYVIYTSGSTGQPKGVEITHRSLVNFLCAMGQEPGLSAERRRWWR